jgi:hypothetical protein
LSITILQGRRPDVVNNDIDIDKTAFRAVNCKKTRANNFKQHRVFLFRCGAADRKVEVIYG